MFVSLFVLAWIDSDTLGLQSLPRFAMTGVMRLLGIYAMYSVMRYFGMARAAGADHFDPKYRDMPLVRDGIFRYTSNGMYVYAFLLFWAIAIQKASGQGDPSRFQTNQAAPTSNTRHTACNPWPVDSSGFLVSAVNSAPLLDMDDQPIRIDCLPMMRLCMSSNLFLIHQNWRTHDQSSGPLG